MTPRDLPEPVQWFCATVVALAAFAIAWEIFL